MKARPSCFRLLVHWMRRAASRADCTAGKQQGDQDGDDGDHDQQLDQRETGRTAMSQTKVWHRVILELKGQTSNAKRIDRSDAKHWTHDESETILKI